MRTTQDILENMKETSKVVSNKNISEEELSELISDYHKSAIQVLLDNGYVRISDNMRINLVRLKPRRYVLRGNSYMNHRKYKLKVTISDVVYTLIEKTYSSLLGD